MSHTTTANKSAKRAQADTVRIATRIALSALTVSALGTSTLSLAQAEPAHTAPISVHGDGPYYRLTLPIAIYGHAASSDLGDLRIRNAAGHGVPFAWLRNEASNALTHSQDVPIFALPRQGDDSGTGDSDPSLGFKLRPDGSLTLVANNQADAKATQAKSHNDWLIDLSQVKGNLLQARFAIPPEAQGMYSFWLEVSDDLKQWHPIGNDEHLVRLNHGGHQIERLSVDLNNLRSRFLRLRWSDPQHTVPLVSVGIDSLQERAQVPRIEWSAALKPASCSSDSCDYLLPAGLPLQSLRIDLADINSLAPIRISGLRDAGPASDAASRPPPNPLYALRHQQSRATARTQGAYETTLIDTVVYRLAQGGAELRSPVLALDGAAYSRLRLRTTGSIKQLGATAPTLTVGATPRTLIFLAQGQAPFSLTWSGGTNSRIAEGAALSLSTLVPGYAVDRPIAAGEAQVSLPVAGLNTDPSNSASAQPAQTDTARPNASRKWWLWGALALGLLLLAAMAASLFASLRREQSSNSA